MKKGYKRLLILELIIFIIIVLNSFVSNILDGYTMVMFLLTVTIVFRKYFGYEKDKHRYMRDIIYEVAIFLLLFFIAYYLFGLVTGFVRTNNYYSFNGFWNYILPTVLIIIIKEFLRYEMLSKADGSKLLLTTTCITFVLIDITVAFYYANLSTEYATFLFVALTLLPAISTNITCSYMSLKAGYKPVIIYLLGMRLYTYLLPIIPNPNEYLLSVIEFLAPVIMGYRVYKFFQKDYEKDEEVSRDYHKKRKLTLILPAILVIGMVYFTSGYFHYHAIVVATGSMMPTIHKGDVVVIEKIDENYDELEEGQIIAYHYSGRIIVHRLVRILQTDGNYYFYTKGDHNNAEDAYTIEENMIIGTVNLRIPFIGLPTVWLNEL